MTNLEALARHFGQNLKGEITWFITYRSYIAKSSEDVAFLKQVVDASGEIMKGIIIPRFEIEVKRPYGDGPRDAVTEKYYHSFLAVHTKLDSWPFWLRGESNLRDNITLYEQNAARAKEQRESLERSTFGWLKSKQKTALAKEEQEALALEASNRERHANYIRDTSLQMQKLVGHDPYVVYHHGPDLCSGPGARGGAFSSFYLIGNKEATTDLMKFIAQGTSDELRTVFQLMIDQSPHWYSHCSSTKYPGKGYFVVPIKQVHIIDDVK